MYIPLIRGELLYLFWGEADFGNSFESSPASPFFKFIKHSVRGGVLGQATLLLTQHAIYLFHCIRDVLKVMISHLWSKEIKIELLNLVAKYIKLRCVSIITS